MTLRLFILLLMLPVAALFSIHASRRADAAVCGGIDKFGKWTCNRSAQCGAGWRSGGQMFPDRASCLRRSTTPAKSAKTEAPAKKQTAQAAAEKKPRKQTQKTAEAKPKVEKSTSVEKSDSRLPSEADETQIAMQPDAQATKVDRNVDPQPQPVVTA